MDLCRRLVTGSVSEAVLAIVSAVRTEPSRGTEMIRGARLLSQRLEEAAVQFEFAQRVMEVGAGAPPPSPGTDTVRRLEVAGPRRESAVLQRVMRDIASPPVVPRATLEDDEDDGVEPAAELRTLLATLPDHRQIPHVALKLKSQYPGVTRVPRQQSRGNAALHVLDKFGRSRTLSVADLIFAFRTMNVIKPDVEDAEARRTVGWELSELIRRKWPVIKVLGEGYRFGEPGEAAM
jgi:hypothetical protein